MIFKPFPSFVQIKRIEETPPEVGTDAPIWVPPPKEKLHEIYEIVELVAVHPSSELRVTAKIVVDSRMIESFQVDGQKIEFIKEQYIVGALKDE